MNLNFVDKCINIVTESNDSLSQDEIAEIRYGLEILQTNIPKIIAIGFASFLLGQFNEFIMLLIIMSFLRSKAFGIHAEKSSTCFIVSLLMYIGAQYMIVSFDPTLIVHILICILGLISMYLFAPADTEKRPLLNKKKRELFKKQALFITMTIVTLSIIFFGTTFSECCMWGIILTTIMINPITYVLAGQSYNNYEKIEEENL